MSRLAEILRARVMGSPLALRAHALLVLATATMLGGGEWPRAFYIFVVVIVMWGLLGGERVAWWIELSGVAFALAGLWGAWQRVIGIEGLSAFVSPTVIALSGALLFAAGVLLLTPVVRRHCDVTPRAPLGAVGLALAAVFVGPFQAMALGVEGRLPTRSNSLTTPNLVHVGTDPGAPSVFYVGGHSRDVCIVVLEPRSSSRSCHSRNLDLEHVDGVRTEHVQAWALPGTVARVDVVYDEGVRREAESLFRPGAKARVFYTSIALDEVRGIEAYDASGDRVVRCRFCHLPVEVDP
ncbi:MAG TPA: hypothetical protein VEU29_07305 [Actinomycetota bacterium]|nr:hypothetical protein [Actinomycetota bacterium]